MADTEKNKGHQSHSHPASGGKNDSFVLEKHIFSNIFERDIRRVYIYKKAERLARALHMVSPAFKTSPALRQRADEVAMALVDAAVLPPIEARAALARELLSLSSILSLAHAGGTLSSMNTELIGREARHLLQEIAGYEEPRIAFEDAPTLAELSKSAASATPALPSPSRATAPRPAVQGHKGQYKGQTEDNRAEAAPGAPSRREAIVSILGTKGPSYIKDISTLIRGVSEKTVQRELQKLVEEGAIVRTGERRWTTYALKGV